MTPTPVTPRPPVTDAGREAARAAVSKARLLPMHQRSERQKVLLWLDRQHQAELARATRAEAERDAALAREARLRAALDDAIKLARDTFHGDHHEDFAEAKVRIERARAALTKTADPQRPDPIAAAEARVWERAIAVCEEQQRIFGSPEYAIGQPLSSFSERFACGQCIAALRALAPSTPQPAGGESE